MYDILFGSQKYVVTVRIFGAVSDEFNIERIRI
jgi:hypothetical protein